MIRSVFATETTSNESEFESEFEFESDRMQARNLRTTERNEASDASFWRERNLERSNLN